MPLPERMKPEQVSHKKIDKLTVAAEFILSKINNGAKEDDVDLQALIADWNSHVMRPYVFSDFRDFSSWTDAREFTRMAFNTERFYEDFTWPELVELIEFLCSAEGQESEESLALSILERNFPANPSDLIYWPDDWFCNPELCDINLTAEEMAAYLMTRSGRYLADAPVIALKHPIPLPDVE